MTVEELIKKLKKCPKKAVVCWDSHNVSYWFGEDVEIEKGTKQDILDNLHDEDGNLGDNFPKNMRHQVVLR